MVVCGGVSGTGATVVVGGVVSGTGGSSVGGLVGTVICVVGSGTG